MLHAGSRPQRIFDSRADQEIEMHETKTKTSDFIIDIYRALINCAAWTRTRILQS